QGRGDVVRRVRDQRRVVIAAYHAVVLQEIQQIWHLLEIGWDVRIVATQMYVVEGDVNEPLDFMASGIGLAGGLHWRGFFGGRRSTRGRLGERNGGGG